MIKVNGHTAGIKFVGNGRMYTNSVYYPTQEQITDVSGFTKLYDTSSSVDFGSKGTKVNTALGLTNESTITSNMNSGWDASASCYYDSENKIGAYGGYDFGEELYITNTKFWLGRYSGQNKNIPITIQWLDENDNWNDLAEVVVTTTLSYPTNIFEVTVNKGCYGIRWIHKTEQKTGGNNITFFGMTLYKGIGESIEVFVPESGLNEIPQGYDGFGPVLI